MFRKPKAASAGSTGHEDSPANDSPVTFDKTGLTLHALEEFVENLGGSEVTKGMTTEQVMEKFVKPRTEFLKCSYVETLKKRNHPGVGPAEVYVSHARKEKFNDVLDALVSHLRDSPNVLLWTDILCINQHLPPVIRTTWLNLYCDAMEQSKRLILVVNAWANRVPLPLTRMWCLYELYNGAISSCQLEVAMCPRDKDSLNRSLRSDFVDATKLFSFVRCDRAETTVADDKEKLFRGIRVTEGWGKLNNTIHKYLENWLISYAQLKYEEETEEDIKLNMAEGLAGLYMQQGNYGEAERLFKECLEGRKDILGELDPVTLATYNSVASVYEKKGQLDVAEKYYHDCMDKRTVVLGERHPDTLLSLNNLAYICSEQGKMEEAEKLYVECYEKSKDTLGATNFDTLWALNSLAMIYFKRQKYAEAEPLLIECLKKRAQTIGPDHPATLCSLSNLAGHFVAENKYMTAEPMLVQCFERRKAILGDEHPQTNAVVVQMVELHHRMKEALGDKNVDTIAAMEDLAGMYKALGRHEEAMQLCKENGIAEVPDLGSRGKEKKKKCLIM